MNMKILISTGIYPPKIGGPAQYSKNLANELSLMGHSVGVSTFTLENYLPSGIRHAYFFLKVFPKVLLSDYVIALDTFSVGLPTVLACKILNKKVVIRTGGDFLWESYVERTGKMILFRNFYREERQNFSAKDKIIFFLTKWTLNNCGKVIFSTEWQRKVFIEAYDLPVARTEIIENYYGEKETDLVPKEKIFVASARNLAWKNSDTLNRVFDRVRLKHPDVKLFTDNIEFSQFMNIIKTSYAVILVSIGDISPNLILDAIRYNRPFVCTKEVGIIDRIGDAGVFVDPFNESEIENAIISMLDEGNYSLAKKKVSEFSFTHTWKEIADEFIKVHKLLT